MVAHQQEYINETRVATKLTIKSSKVFLAMTLSTTTDSSDATTTNACTLCSVCSYMKQKYRRMIICACEVNS